MKFQVGDRIMIVHSGEEGKILDFIHVNMALVEVADVSFPVFLDQIDFPYYKLFTEKKELKKRLKVSKRSIENIRTETQKPSLTFDGILLSLLPVFDKIVFEEDTIDYFRLTLINATPDSIHFMYKLILAKQTSFELTSQLQPGQDVYLHNVSIEEMNESPRFIFSFSLDATVANKKTTMEVQHRIKPKQLFSDLEKMRKTNQAHFTYELLKNWPDKEEQAESQFPHGGERRQLTHMSKRIPNPPSVIDLHIEKLTPHWKNLMPHEILDLQIAAFEQSYEAIVYHRQPMLTVIHGVGKGVLRDEIHALLHAKREVSSFIHQFHPLFGYGATEIYLRY